MSTPISLDACLPTSRSRLGLPGLPVLAALAAFGLVLFDPAFLDDGDTFWHLATGRWILAHGAIPQADPFSYSRAGAAWHAQEWLAELLMGLADHFAGWNGVLLLYAAAAAAVAGSLAAHLRRHLSLPAASLALLLALGCVLPLLAARPHLLALVVLSVWLSALLRARERGRPPPAALALLMVVWANLHGSFPLGLVLAGGLGVEAVLSAAPDGRARAARGWGGFLLLSLSAASLTPWGPSGLLFPASLLHMAVLPHIREWQPPDFSTWQPLEPALLAVLYVGLTRPLRVSLPRSCLLLALLHQALGQQRHGIVLGVAGALLLAAPLGEAFVRPATEPPARPPAVARVALTALLFGLLASARLAWPTAPAESPLSPVAALASVPPGLRSRPLLNGYDNGGFLVLSQVRPFIDSRADLYGDAFLSRYIELASGDPAALREVLDRFQPQWALLGPSSPLARRLSALPGWHVLHADPDAVVLVRGDPVAGGLPLPASR